MRSKTSSFSKNQTSKKRFKCLSVHSHPTEHCYVVDMLNDEMTSVRLFAVEKLADMAESLDVVMSGSSLEGILSVLDDAILEHRKAAHHCLW